MAGPEANARSGKRVFITLFLAIVIAGAVLRGWNIGRPMEEGWHSLGLHFAVPARNHLRYGLGTTWGFMVQNPGPDSPEHFEFYTRHPPLLPLIHAGFFSVFGQSLTVYRLTLIGLSLTSLVLLMALANRVYGRSTALLAGAVLAACPQAAIWATCGVSQVAGPTTFILVGLAGRLLVRPKHAAVGRSIELGGYGAAALCDWPGFLAFGIPLLAAVVDRRGVKTCLRALPTLALGILLFVALGVWTSHAMDRLPGGQIGGPATANPLHWSLVNAVQEMMDDPARAGAVLRPYFENQFAAFTAPLLCLLCAGGCLAVLGRARGATDPDAGRGRLFPLALAILAPGALFSVLALRLTLVHVFATTVLVPALALLAGILLARWWNTGTAGRVVVVLWLAWFCSAAVPYATRTLQEAADDGIQRACDVAVEGGSEQDLLLLYEFKDLFTYDWYSGRNRFHGCRGVELPTSARAYLRRHPDAKLVYILPPIRKSALLLDPSREAARREYRKLEALLDANWTSKSVAGYRIYKLP